MVPGSATSEAAARRIEPTRLSKRELVYAYILSRGDAGATRPEIAEALNMSENTVRPRVCELMNAHDDERNIARVKAAPTGATRRGCAILFAAPFYPKWAAEAEAEQPAPPAELHEFTDDIARDEEADLVPSSDPAQQDLFEGAGNGDE
jgi:hypothetical protein